MSSTNVDLYFEGGLRRRVGVLARPGVKYFHSLAIDGSHCGPIVRR